MIKRLFLLLLLLPCSAFADETVWRGLYGGKITDAATPQASCNLAAAALSGPNTAGTSTTTWTIASVTGTTGTSATCNGTFRTVYTDTTRTPTTGGPQAIASASKLVCAAPKPYYDYSLRVCVAAPPAPPPPEYCQDKNPFIRRFNYPSSSATVPTPDHYAACVIEAIEMLVCRKDATTGESYCMWMVKRTGQVYEGTDPPGSSGDDKPEVKSDPPVVSPPIKPPPTNSPEGPKCPAGTVQGGVAGDGTLTCFGTGTAPKNSPPPPPKVESSKSEAMPDGGTKTTQTTTTTNSDGSKTTTTNVTITASDGTKTVTSDKATGTNTAGSAGKDESNREDDKYDLCKQNPTLSVCRNSSVSGSCGAITCQGDAIQCATLRAAAAMECRDKANLESLEKSPLTAAGNKVLDGTDTTAADFVKGTTVDMSKQALDQSGFLSGSCLANRSFTVSGHSVEVSFARVCESIQPLRAVVMACAFIISYLIVSRSVIQG